MTLLNSYPLVLDKKLAVILGLNEALVLQQIHYWLEINKKDKRNLHAGKYWTYNTIDEWQEEFPFWSKSTIKRIFKNLRDMAILETDNFNSYQMDRTLWYTINYEKLEEICGPREDNMGKVQNDNMISSKGEDYTSQNEPMEESIKTPPLPENTTEISSEICNQSINPSQKSKISNINDYRDDGWIDKTDSFYDNFKVKYEKIINACEIHLIDEKYRKAVAYSIRLLLLDIQRNNPIKLGNNLIPAKLVEKEISKLDFFVIEHVVNKFKEISSTQEIRNPIGYLKTLIYNSINEVEIDIDSKIRYTGFIT